MAQGRGAIYHLIIIAAAGHPTFAQLSLSEDRKLKDWITYRLRKERPFGKQERIQINEQSSNELARKNRLQAEHYFIQNKHGECPRPPSTKIRSTYRQQL